MVNETAMLSQVLAQFVTGVRDIRSTQLVSFICIEREVELIWKKRWSVIKFAFLWHRYFGLLCVILQVYALNPREVNDKVCSFWFYWETWGYCAVLFTSEAVLLLWIYVVYNKNRFILCIISICYIAEVASVLVILTLSFENFQAKAFGLLGFEYCVMAEPPSIFRLLWVPILAYDSLLLLLFVYRGCSSSLGCNRKLSYGHDNLLDMVYRHSLLNFLAIFGSYLSCAIIWTTHPIGLYQAPVAFALALSLTNCTRLLLNIRRAYYSGSGDPLLFNIRDIPATGANTPNMLDAPTLTSAAAPIPVPLSPHQECASCESTLRDRDLNASPTSMRRLVSSPIRISIATTSSEHLRQVPSRYLEPAHPENADPSAVYVTPGLDNDWWQYELREMRADPRLVVGEAV
ncbi:hypothetical protein FKP32DRAFT_1618893 [Trametes sanguinea]|nr:hypothetical protein FKP32DRAFT_1618893 [Trametes sanguinea]